jgi:hypothetical protein
VLGEIAVGLVLLTTYVYRVFRVGGRCFFYFFLMAPRSTTLGAVIPRTTQSR